MPTPSWNRPPVSSELVAAAWAMIAGWIRIVGHVTAVVIGSDVALAIAPMTLHTKGLSPCSSFQGWKWSEIQRASKPASSARTAWRTSWSGRCSSLDRK